MSTPAEIRKLFDTWNAALATGRPGKVAACYAFNAILLPTVSNAVRHDHAEIEAYFEQFLKNKPQGKIDESNVRIYGNTAIDSGVYTFTLQPPGAAKTKVQARYTFVYQWFGDRWLIVEHHSSRMPETAAAVAKAKPAAKKKSRSKTA